MIYLYLLSLWGNSLDLFFFTLGCYMAWDNVKRDEDISAILLELWMPRWPKISYDREEGTLERTLIFSRKTLK